jgi:phage shock protein PspC (stress-responsive transcriptional regulator)
MKTVITVNLGGNAYQLEEPAYDALRAYLDTAARRLEPNPDKAEIIADIEQAIADKCRQCLTAHKTVVVAADVERILREMGPVEDGSGAAESNPKGQPQTAAGSAVPPPPAPRRFYRIREGAMLAGVCTGLSAYLQDKVNPPFLLAADPVALRILFVLATVLLPGEWHFLIPLIYFLLALFVPAETSGDPGAAASSFTAQDIIRMAKEGYYEGLKTLRDKRAHREWKRRFKRDVKQWGRGFREQWHRSWPERPAPPAGTHIALPILSLAALAWIILCLLALVSLLSDGTVFGMALPAGFPLWGALIVLFVVYHVVASPLHSFRRACFWRSWGSGAAWSGYGQLWAWEGAIRALAILFIVLLLLHHPPHFHHAFQQLSDQLRRAIDSFRRWWSVHFR